MQATWQLNYFSKIDKILSTKRSFHSQTQNVFSRLILNHTHSLYILHVSPTLDLDYLQLLKHTLYFPTLLAFHYLPSALNILASSAWLLQHCLFILLQITQMLLPLISYCWKHSHSPWCSHSALFILHFELRFIINNKWLFLLTIL